MVRLLLPEDICVCCLDFAGSGLSGGEYITLGKREPRDLKIIVTFLRTIGLVQIGLWGRSMGAVTALRSVRQPWPLSLLPCLGTTTTTHSLTHPCSFSLSSSPIGHWHDLVLFSSCAHSLALTCRYLHIERDLTISGILVDSPFTTLVNLIHHLVSQKNVPR